jgi:hypothetical protein
VVRGEVPCARVTPQLFGEVLHTLQGVCVASCELFSWHSQIRCVEGLSHRVSALPVTAARSDWPQRETISSEFGVREQSLRPTAFSRAEGVSNQRAGVSAGHLGAA